MLSPLPTRRGSAQGARRSMAMGRAEMGETMTRRDPERASRNLRRILRTTPLQELEIEKPTPEGVRAVPFLVPHDVVQLQRCPLVCALRSCRLSEPPSVAFPNSAFPILRPPCTRLTSILADSYDPRRYQALRVQVVLCLPARVREGGLAQAEGCATGRASSCGVPGTSRRCCASTSSFNRRRRMDEREARQAAEAANAEKTISVSQPLTMGHTLTVLSLTPASHRRQSPDAER